MVLEECSPHKILWQSPSDTQDSQGYASMEEML